MTTWGWWTPAGRLAFWAAKMPAQHDLYNAAAGAYTLWGLALLGQQLHRIAGVASAMFQHRHRQWLLDLFHCHAAAALQPEALISRGWRNYWDMQGYAGICNGTSCDLFQRLCCDMSV